MKTSSDAEIKVSARHNSAIVNQQLRQAFDLCVHKTRWNIKRLADEPKTWSNAVDGRYETYDEDFYEIGNWTSSFFTGMALIAWRETEDEFFLNQVLRLAPHYHEKVITHYRTPTTISASFTRFSSQIMRWNTPAQAVGFRQCDERGKNVMNRVYPEEIWTAEFF